MIVGQFTVIALSVTSGMIYPSGSVQLTLRQVYPPGDPMALALINVRSVAPQFVLIQPREQFDFWYDAYKQRRIFTMTLDLTPETVPCPTKPKTSSTA